MVIGIDPNNDFNMSSMKMTLTEGLIIKDNSKELIVGKLALEDFIKVLMIQLLLKMKNSQL